MAPAPRLVCVLFAPFEFCSTPESVAVWDWVLDGLDGEGWRRDVVDSDVGAEWRELEDDATIRAAAVEVERAEDERIDEVAEDATAADVNVKVEEDSAAATVSVAELVSEYDVVDSSFHSYVDDRDVVSCSYVAELDSASGEGDGEGASVEDAGISVGLALAQTQTHGLCSRRRFGRRFRRLRSYARPRGMTM